MVTFKMRDEQDAEDLVVVLAKNGYAVRVPTDKQETGRMMIARHPVLVEVLDAYEDKEQ